MCQFCLHLTDDNLSALAALCWPTDLIPTLVSFLKGYSVSAGAVIGVCHVFKGLTPPLCELVHVAGGIPPLVSYLTSPLATNHAVMSAVCYALQNLSNTKHTEKRRTTSSQLEAITTLANLISLQFTADEDALRNFTTACGVLQSYFVPNDQQLVIPAGGIPALVSLLTSSLATNTVIASGACRILHNINGNTLDVCDITVLVSLLANPLATIDAMDAASLALHTAVSAYNKGTHHHGTYGCWCVCVCVSLIHWQYLVLPDLHCLAFIPPEYMNSQHCTTTY